MSFSQHAHLSPPVRALGVPDLAVQPLGHVTASHVPTLSQQNSLFAPWMPEAPDLSSHPVGHVKRLHLAQLLQPHER